MSKITDLQNANVAKLAEALKEHLAELNYSESSRKAYGYILNKFVKYCADKGVDAYSIQLGRDFVWDCYGFVLGEKDSGKSPNRAMYMLAEYQRYGMLFKRHSIVMDGFSAENEPLFEGFLSHLEKMGTAPSSIRKYRVFLFRLEGFFKNRGIMCFRDADLRHLTIYIESHAGLSRNTVAAVVWNLKRLSDFAYGNGYHEKNYSESLPMVRYSKVKKLPTAFTPEETERILAHIDRNNPTGKRNYAAIMLVAKLGLRVSDIIGLRFSSIDWQEKRLSILQQKTGKPLDLPLPDDVGWAIIEYLKNGRPESDCDNVFIRHNAPYDAMTSGFGKDIVSAVQKAGVKIPANKTVGMHAFRRSLATALLNNGAKMGDIAQVLGQVRPESADEYINTNADMLRQCGLEVAFQ